MIFTYEMIHSRNLSQDEDYYYYSNVTCRTDSKQVYPCEEIYFGKNTKIPFRFIQVPRQGWNVNQSKANYKMISIGKLDDKYFDSIPRNWSFICERVMLSLL